jgi:ketosteroid isomerase-like protein
MTTGIANRKATDRAQLRALIDDRVKAVRDKNVNKAMSSIAQDILSFDVVNPFQQMGLDAAKKRAEDWFSAFEGPISYETKDLSITIGDNVAFSHGLSHVSATKTDGGQLDMWWRTTVCFRKIYEKWMVTHEHNSVPFDVESGKALLDFKPIG